MNALPEPPEGTDPTEPQHSRRHGLQLLVVAAIAAVLVVTVAVLAFGHSHHRPHSAAAETQPAPTSAAPASPTATTHTSTSAAPRPSASKRPPVHKPARTTAATAGPVITNTALARGSIGASAGSASSGWPQQVTSSAAPAPASSNPAPPPRPKPTHPATSTPTEPAFVPHFLAGPEPEPAAFAGIPRGGPAQSMAEQCAQNGSCGVTGVEWGGSCNLPAYRGDTAGAAHSGWAIWERAPGDCTWAEAVSSF